MTLLIVFLIGSMLCSGCDDNHAADNYYSYDLALRTVSH